VHIPDGYLSPSTCAALTGAALPFWAVAWRKTREHTPHLALAAAFSFILMMFNIPLPGGTTGHATGAALIGIVIGPWAALLALSMTLAIQAVFFGDGGILAFGANCFNIAIVMPFVGAGVYRVIAGSGRTPGVRRTIASCLAGYGAINAAAFCAAVEFGIQPALFRDAAGVPLYSPFPLSVSLPAMMIGHLTLFGLIEAAVTAGVLHYILRWEPELIEERRHARRSTAWTRAAWATLLVFALATPLGLLASGEAWGEWEEWTRVVWPAVFGGYGESWLPYIASAFIGTLLCAVAVAVIVRMARGRRAPRIDEGAIARASRMLAEMADTPASRPDVDARTVLVAACAGIVLLNVVRDLPAIGSAALLPFACLGLPGFNRRAFIRRLATFVPIIAVLFALPAAIMVPGREVYVVFDGVSITEPGLVTALRIALRSGGSLAFMTCAVIMCGTARVLAALRALGIPPGLTMSIAMAFRYASVLGRSVLETEAGYASRSPLTPGLREGARRVAAALRRSFELSSQVQLALVSRGHTGLFPPSPGLTLRDARFAAAAAIALAIPIIIEIS